MQVIAVLTAHAERGKLDARPEWAKQLYREGGATLIVVDHPDPLNAGHFDAYVFDDQGTCIGRAEADKKVLLQLMHGFLAALRLRWEPHGEGVVPIPRGPIPGPPGGDDRKQSGFRNHIDDPRQIHDVKHMADIAVAHMAATRRL
jgi:hypothetical protein